MLSSFSQFLFPSTNECCHSCQAVMLTKFDYRLSNRLDLDLQKLRCRVNYHALKFTNSILEMGAKLVQRMRKRSKHYIALHLRCLHRVFYLLLQIYTLTSLIVMINIILSIAFQFLTNVGSSICVISLGVSVVICTSTFGFS